MTVKLSRVLFGPKKRLARVTLLIIVIVSIPLGIAPTLIRQSQPVITYSAGWAAVTLPQYSAAADGAVAMRLVYDPFYRLTEPGGDLTWIAENLTFPPQSFINYVRENFTKPSVGYALLMCSLRGYNGRPVRGSLVLQGDARLWHPLMMTQEGPLFEAPQEQKTSPYKIASTSWSDLQSFPFSVDNVQQCTSGVPTLGQGLTFADRSGAEARSGFVILGLAQSPPMVTGAFLGIAGPARALRTPLIGGIPGQTPAMPGDAFTYPGGGGYGLASPIPTEIVNRDAPPNMRFVDSSPQSMNTSSLDIVSGVDASASINMLDTQSDLDWSHAELAANIYMGIILSVAAALLFELLWSRRGIDRSVTAVQGSGRDSSTTLPVKNSKKNNVRAHKDNGRRKRRQRKRYRA